MKSCFFLFLTLIGFIQTGLSKDRPNILVILTDDQGWADIGYNNPAVYTPNMDKLAQEELFSPIIMSCPSAPPPGLH